MEKLLKYELQRQGVDAELSGRAKNIYSIHQKMEKYAEMGKSFNDIYDLIAIRVLVDSVADCYHALGRQVCRQNWLECRQWGASEWNILD